MRVRIEKKNYSKTKMYMLFCQYYLTIFEETVRSLEKEVLIAPGLFDVTDVVTKIHTVGKKTALDLKNKSQNKKQSYHKKTVKSNRTFSISLPKLWLILNLTSIS